MSIVKISEADSRSLDRVNKLLKNIPGGAYKAVYSALKRAGQSAKTKAGQFAAAEYTISKGDFMRNVTVKERLEGNASSVVSMNVTYSGNVLPLLTFKTRYGKNGYITTQVMQNGGAATLQRAFASTMRGSVAVYEREGAERLPIRQLYGPSTAHMLRNEKVQEQMGQTVQEVFQDRLEHELYRILNGWGTGG